MPAPVPSYVNLPAYPAMTEWAMWVRTGFDRLLYPAGAAFLQDRPRGGDVCRSVQAAAQQTPWQAERVDRVILAMLGGRCDAIPQRGLDQHRLAVTMRAHFSQPLWDRAGVCRAVVTELNGDGTYGPGGLGPPRDGLSERQLRRWLYEGISAVGTALEQEE